MIWDTGDCKLTGIQTGISELRRAIIQMLEPYMISEPKIEDL